MVDALVSGASVERRAGSSPVLGTYNGGLTLLEKMVKSPFLFVNLKVDLIIFPLITTEFNQQRLDYLLSLYGMSKQQLLSHLNQGRVKKLTLEDIDGQEIKVSVLKRIDEIFHKGLPYYLDFTSLPIDRNSKVLFRKKRFHSSLTIEDKRIVDSFESLKSLLDGYRVLTDTESKEYNFKGTSSINEDPRLVADSMRSHLLPDNDIKDHKKYLQEIIKNLANLNVYVFEFIETWNKRDKSTIDGFYLDPNVIVLKRQKSYKREIFTLAHEIGHYLLGVEEVESLDMSRVDKSRVGNKVERWCNDFAFYLIAGKSVDELDKFNDYSEDLNDAIDKLSTTTHISRMAWYTKMAYENRMPIPKYHYIIKQLEDENEAKQQELKKELDNKPSSPRSPKPIISPLYLETMQYAYYNGLISESVFCEKLRIPKNKLEKYL